METYNIVAILVFSCGLDCAVGDTCYTNGRYTDKTNCSDGCCGISPNQYCCALTTNSSNVEKDPDVNIGAVVGGAVGGTVVVSISITIVFKCSQKFQIKCTCRINRRVAPSTPSATETTERRSSKEQNEGASEPKKKSGSPKQKSSVADHQQGHCKTQQSQNPPQPNAGQFNSSNPAYPPPYPGNNDNAPPQT